MLERDRGADGVVHGSAHDAVAVVGEREEQHLPHDVHWATREEPRLKSAKARRHGSGGSYTGDRALPLRLAEPLTNLHGARNSANAGDHVGAVVPRPVARVGQVLDLGRRRRAPRRRRRRSAPGRTGRGRPRAPARGSRGGPGPAPASARRSSGLVRYRRRIARCVPWSKYGQIVSARARGMVRRSAKRVVAPMTISPTPRVRHARAIAVPAVAGQQRHGVDDRRGARRAPGGAGPTRAPTAPQSWTTRRTRSTLDEVEEARRRSRA